MVYLNKLVTQKDTSETSVIGNTAHIEINVKFN